MSFHDLSPEEINKYKIAFQILDKDNDGKISRDQFTEIIKKAVGETDTADNVESVLREMNADENGDVNFAGFLSAMVATKDEDLSMICCSAEDILRDLGADKDKSLGVADWKRLLDSMGMRFTVEEIEAVMNKIGDITQEVHDDDDEAYETIDESTAGETSADEDGEKSE